jgi:hypothetical protein
VGPRASLDAVVKREITHGFSFSSEERLTVPVSSGWRGGESNKCFSLLETYSYVC